MKEFIVRVIDPVEIRWFEEEPETPELIRCKDCKFMEKAFDGTYSCREHGTPLTGKSDFYCADGERKDGENNVSFSD